MSRPDEGQHLPRVAILGGGMAGLTVAHELSRPGWQSRFESITVYQLGWRLGGKGASGRSEDGRIEEHGLHIWFGFYENAFRLLRDCYEELGPERAPFGTIDNAFEPASVFVVQENRGPAGWQRWLAKFPETAGRPGDPAIPLRSLWGCLVRALELAREFASSIQDEGPASPLERLRYAAAEVVDVTVEVAMREALDFASSLGADPRLHGRDAHDWLRGLVERAMAVIRGRLPHCEALPDPARRAWYLADILLACVRGVLRHELLHGPGLDAIDDYDFAEWLAVNGAAPESVRCPLITATVYDLPFAYRDGDPGRPAGSAATALRGLARLFLTYKGAFAWRMCAGMGDVVFAPLYQVLTERGVEFQFFRRVKQLCLSRDKSQIEQIDLGVQARLGHRPYHPLVELKDLKCWPSLECWPSKPPADIVGDATADELESNWPMRLDAYSQTLRRGEDFDHVVLAIPVGAHPLICGQLIDDSPAWRRMVYGLGTVATQSFQLWLKRSLRELGCHWPQAISAGYVEPFDTYADMRQLIEAERWSPGQVGAIAYFCNAMSDLPGADGPAKLERARREVRDNAVRFLSTRMEELWPSAVHRYPTDFRWELLVGEGEGPERFDSQYYRANVDPSERYVQSLPGTARYRLEPGASGYANLTLAGDWTACRLNAGCIEAAVISGMFAARAIDPSIGDRIVDWNEADEVRT